MGRAPGISSASSSKNSTSSAAANSAPSRRPPAAPRLRPLRRSCIPPVASRQATWRATESEQPLAMTRRRSAPPRTRAEPVERAAQLFGAVMREVHAGDLMVFPRRTRWGWTPSCCCADRLQTVRRRVDKLRASWVAGSVLISTTFCSNSRATGQRSALPSSAARMSYRDDPVDDASTWVVTLDAAKRLDTPAARGSAPPAAAPGPPPAGQGSARASMKLPGVTSNAAWAWSTTSRYC